MKNAKHSVAFHKLTGGDPESFVSQFCELLCELQEQKRSWLKTLGILFVGIFIGVFGCWLFVSSQIEASYKKGYETADIQFKAVIPALQNQGDLLDRQQNEIELILSKQRLTDSGKK